MRRDVRQFTALLMCVLTLASGCAPTQPFFYHEDGDLSHYKGVATEVEYTEVCQQTSNDIETTKAPLTVANSENFQTWDLRLEEVTRITLANSQVMRQLGGRVSDQGANIASTTPEGLTGPGGANATTTYDPALVESGYGGNTGSQLSGTGVEAALSEFDAQLNGSLTWGKNDRPQNFGLVNIPNFFAPRFQQDTGVASLGVTKTAATGTTFALRGNTNYDQNNNGSRIQPSDWFTNVEASFTQPFLQGGGVQYNRIAGPRSFQEYDGGFADQFDGVMIARIRYDISLADFETGVRNVMRDVEDAYWELYFAYRDLEARKSGRDSAVTTWQRVIELQRAGSAGGEADKEAQARSQYYLFRSQVETALTTVFRQENRLRYLMGLPMSDGRLVRPIDEPTTAQVQFDWPAIHAESLVRRTELRRQKWQIKRRELELIAARNGVLPRLDAVGTYRWLGAGDVLLDSNRNGIEPFNNGSSAFESLTGGEFQEWQLGLQFSLPIGFRKALTTVRNHQLLLAHERALLKDMELEVSHQLGDAVRDVDLNYELAESNFNRRKAAQDQVDAVAAIYDVGKTTFDQLLEAQRLRAEAESAYYRSLIDYNRAIMRLHYRKGSLLEYNGVYLAEGPWPGKAYFDALRRARQRDAALNIDYGYTRPDVVSRGTVPQTMGGQNGATPSATLAPDVANSAEPLAPPFESNKDAGPKVESMPEAPQREAQPDGEEPMPAPPVVDPAVEATSLTELPRESASATVEVVTPPPSEEAVVEDGTNSPPPPAKFGLQNPFTGAPVELSVKDDNDGSAIKSP